MMRKGEEPLSASIVDTVWDEASGRVCVLAVPTCRLPLSSSSSSSSSPRHGNATVVLQTRFQPFFYVQLPDAYAHERPDAFREACTQVRKLVGAGDEKQRIEVARIEYAQLRPVRPFLFGYEMKLLRLHFDRQEQLVAARRALWTRSHSTMLGLEGGKLRCELNLFEWDIHPLDRVLSQAYCGTGELSLSLPRQQQRPGPFVLSSIDDLRQMLASSNESGDSSSNSIVAEHCYTQLVLSVLTKTAGPKEPGAQVLMIAAIAVRPCAVSIGSSTQRQVQLGMLFRVFTWGDIGFKPFHPATTVKHSSSEGDCLAAFLQWQETVLPEGPDAIVAHGMYGGTFRYLRERIKTRCQRDVAEVWSRLPRSCSQDDDNDHEHQQPVQTVAGTLLLDTQDFLLRWGDKQDTYDLATSASTVLLASATPRRRPSPTPTTGAGGGDRVEVKTAAQDTSTPLPFEDALCRAFSGSWLDVHAWTPPSADIVRQTVFGGTRLSEQRTMLAAGLFKNCLLTLRLLHESHMLTRLVAMAATMRMSVRSLIASGPHKQQVALMMHDFAQHGLLLNQYHIPERDPFRSLYAPIPGMTGGLVRTPCSGRYSEPIVELDFKQMYPSIIVHFGTCMGSVTTRAMLERARKLVPGAEQHGKQPQILLSMPVEYFEEVVIVKDAPTAYIPRLQQRLATQRQRLQQEMDKEDTSPEQRRVLNCWQKSVKLAQNGLAGSLATHGGMFVFPLVAATITKLGRLLQGATVRIILAWSPNDDYKRRGEKVAEAERSPDVATAVGLLLEELHLTPHENKVKPLPSAAKHGASSKTTKGEDKQEPGTSSHSSKARTSIFTTTNASGSSDSFTSKTGQGGAGGGGKDSAIVMGDTDGLMVRFDCKDILNSSSSSSASRETIVHALLERAFAWGNQLGQHVNRTLNSAVLRVGNPRIFLPCHVYPQKKVYSAFRWTDTVGPATYVVSGGPVHRRDSCVGLRRMLEWLDVELLRTTLWGHSLAPVLALLSQQLTTVVTTTGSNSEDLYGLYARVMAVNQKRRRYQTTTTPKMTAVQQQQQPHPAFLALHRAAARQRHHASGGQQQQQQSPVAAVAPGTRVRFVHVMHEDEQNNRVAVTELLEFAQQRQLPLDMHFYLERHFIPAVQQVLCLFAASSSSSWQDAARVYLKQQQPQRLSSSSAAAATNQAGRKRPRDQDVEHQQRGDDNDRVKRARLQ